MSIVPAQLPNPAMFRARWVLPISQPPIEDGAVMVRGLSIDEVGRFKDMRKKWPANSIVDLGDTIIFPGLINCHTHLENSALAGKTPRSGGNMIAWVDAHRKATEEITDSEHEQERIKAWHSLPGLGTIFVADISFEPYRRENIGPEPLWSSVFFEVRGYGINRAEENYAKAEEMRAQGARTVSGVWTRFAIAPHGPHSLNEAVLKQVADQCVKRGDVVSIHLAESPDEVAFLKGNDNRFEEALRSWGYWEEGFEIPGCSPVKFLDQLGVLTSELMGVHCVQLDDDDIGLMAERGATACLCPRSNDYIGIGQPRIVDLLSAGLRLCLGTDGLASVDSLNLFDEMAFIQSHHPAVAPGDILKMATLNGATALRMDSLFGSLEMNKVGRFLVYGGDCKGDPYEVLTGGIDMSKLEWAGGDIDLRP